jgi:phage regulator Rha-like protein
MTDDTTSIDIAKRFGKPHADVMFDIEAIRTSRNYLGSLGWFTDGTHFDGRQYHKCCFVTEHGQMLLGYGRRKS